MPPESNNRSIFSGSQKEHRSYRGRMSDDQKKFRILLLLRKGIPVKKGSIMYLRIEDNKLKLDKLLQTMNFIGWIEPIKQATPKPWKDCEYRISDKGLKIIKMLSVVKALFPNHPLFEFDVFSMNDWEKNDTTLRNSFSTTFAIDPHDNQQELDKIRKFFKIKKEID